MNSLAWFVLNLNLVSSYASPAFAAPESSVDRLLNLSTPILAYVVNPGSGPGAKMGDLIQCHISVVTSEGKGKLSTKRRGVAVFVPLDTASRWTELFLGAQRGEIRLVPLTVDILEAIPTLNVTGDPLAHVRIECESVLPSDVSARSKP